MIVALAGIVGAVAVRMLRKVPAADHAADDREPAEHVAAQANAVSPGDGPASEPPAYSTESTRGVLDDCFRLAFGVTRFDYQIVGEHAAVLQRVNAAASESVHQREYFPRRPMLLPRLLQTLNDTDSTRQELVRLILEDPALADSVLRRANSPFYRLSPEPVDSLDRAVVTLGTDGLRSLVATAIFQPVFRLPKGYFDSFAEVTWEQAQRCAVGAETYARSTRSADPFVAQLLGLLGALARIVLFRVTMDVYREHPNLLPRADVFIRAMQAQGPRLARRVASAWELSDPSIAALDQQVGKVSPAAMTPLGLAVYYGELCGALAMVESRGTRSSDAAQALLVEQGLPVETVHALRHAVARPADAGTVTQ